VVLPSSEYFYGEFATKFLDFTSEQIGEDCCGEIAIGQSVTQFEIGSGVLYGKCTHIETFYFNISPNKWQVREKQHWCIE
jgi:hypothetical protein